MAAVVFKFVLIICCRRYMCFHFLNGAKKKKNLSSVFCFLLLNDFRTQWTELKLSAQQQRVSLFWFSICFSFELLIMPIETPSVSDDQSWITFARMINNLSESVLFCFSLHFFLVWIKKESGVEFERNIWLVTSSNRPPPLNINESGFRENWNKSHERKREYSRLCRILWK